MSRRWRRVLASIGPVLMAVTAAVHADEEIRPDWMKVDTEARTVRLALAAAADGANGTMNFNGYGSGNMTVTVPLGWKVEVDFVNKGLAALPHSLVVINEVAPLPIEGGVPAFPRALTIRLIPGMEAGKGDTFQFVADKPGRFLLFCGVTGHGVAGMWDYLAVSAEANAPSVHVKTKK
jgi:sulfocyanin